uniref:Putative DNA polymerase n=1 Tax=viral metagenome TaxID=1070528 RepID=A0A6M3J4B6_9ZZZZ
MKVKLIAQYHPASALHQPRLWATIIDDWENLPEKVDSDYTVVGWAEVKKWVLAKERAIKYMSMDTENAPNGSLGRWSVAYKDDQGRLCVWSNFGQEHHLRLKQLFASTTVIFHNYKWDRRVLLANRMPIPTNAVDTMLAAYCLSLGRQDIRSQSSSNNDVIGGLGLKYLARRHLGMEMQAWGDVLDEPEAQKVYNAKDSVSTYLLWEKWERNLPKHFWDIDMPLLGVIIDMENRGIAISPGLIKSYDQHLTKEIEKIDLPLNPNANQQIQSYIYGELGIEPFKFTETGMPSTDEDVLEKIDDPIVQGILKYRKLAKEKGTYVDNYTRGFGIDGRLHCEFKQCRTTTGRLSSNNPNLQNVPREGEMRKLFVASEGHKLIRVDWSQLELRIFAALTQDPEMVRAFQDPNTDIHQETAEALGVTRDIAKNINFLMLYGGTEWRISREYGVPLEEAKAYLRLYHYKYKHIQKYFDDIKRQASTDKEVFSYFGRKRRMDALFADDWRVREQGLKEAYNMGIQSTAVDVVKLAMIDLHYKHQAKLLLQVHDELVLEVPTKEANSYAEWLFEYLPSLIEINGMRFPVEVGVGDSWAGAKEDTKKREERRKGK